MRTATTRVERQAQTAGELIDAAERLFTRHGFHATSVADVAAEAGYTTGAVYSNFASKEDLFLTVYQRRAEAAAADVERSIQQLGAAEALERVGMDTATRRGRDDGWLAVFVEFWAHVVRTPKLRERFAEIHTRASTPVAEAVNRLTGGGEGPAVTAAMNVMQIGLALERLTRPGVVHEELAGRVTRLVLADMGRRGEEES
jgi:AcrR family transcriptional regulator